MHKYFIKTPWLARYLFPSYTWHIPGSHQAVFLTFDDGPHPEITPWVLDQLKQFNALATFFCIGKNVEEYPAVYRRILEEGHAVGNHTQNHKNGWKVSNEEYLQDIGDAANSIKSNLFRPPYGKIRAQQAREVSRVMEADAKIIMWDVLSADFDPAFSPAQCLHNVTHNIRAGSIVVFHDSEKAFRNLEYALPRLLMWLQESGYSCQKLHL